MANWMKILAQAIGGKPRKQGGGWHDKWTYEDLMRPDNGEDADPTMFDRFQRQPTTQEQLDAWDRVNQAGPNPMPKLRVKDGKWDPEMVKEMDAWQQRQKEIESQPGYKYEPPLLNGAATQRLKEIATQAVSRQNDEDGRIDTLYSTPTDDPNASTRPRIVPTRPRIVNESPNVDPNANPLPSSQRNLDGDLAAMEANIRDKYAEPIENRKANWMQKMGRGLRKFQAGWNGGKGGLVGGFSAALDPTLDERMNRQQQLNDMFAQYGNLRKMKEAEKADEMQRVNIENINADNQRADEIAKWNRQRFQEGETNKKQAAFYKRTRWSKNNPADVRDATDLGFNPAELPDWDYSRSDVRTMNGISYQYKNGRWQQVDVPSNQLRKYTVTNKETGESETFLVSEAQAAKFKQDMEKVNRQIAGGEKRLKMSLDMRQKLETQRIAAAADLRKWLAVYSADRKDEAARKKAEAARDLLTSIQQQLKDDDEAEQ